MVQKLYAVLISCDNGESFGVMDTSDDPRKMHKKAAFFQRMNPHAIIKCMTYDLGKEIPL